MALISESRNNKMGHIHNIYHINEVTDLDSSLDWIDKLRHNRAIKVNHIVTGSRGLYNEPGDKYFKPDVPMNIVKMHVNRNRGIIEIMINLEFKGEKVTVIVYPFTKDILVIIKNSKADIREFEQAVGLN